MAIRVGLVGTGTVGGGCVRIIQKHGAEFASRYGVEIELARVCSLIPEQAEALGVSDIFTLDYHDIINDPDIDLVIELIGGTTIAKKIVVEALTAGKNVVTANKALMATSGEEILALAAEKGCEIAYEASVGGGIPIIDPLTNNLVANEITSVMGIVNGTTNYMLTRMATEGLSYDACLKEAQALGFAEANPSADVDGFDAAAKIAILAGIAFDARVKMDDVATEGISKLSPIDLEVARDMGYCVKLLAIANRAENGIDVRVHPAMLPLTHQLATVNGVMNAIYVVGDSVGETMFFGAGAGSGPAASAVMGDVVQVARRMTLGIQPKPLQRMANDLPFLPLADLQTKYYIRLRVADRTGVLAAITTIFAQNGVGVNSMKQSSPAEEGHVDVVYVTHVARESDIRASLEQIAQIEDTLVGEPALIRVVE